MTDNFTFTGDLDPEQLDAMATQRVNAITDGMIDQVRRHFESGDNTEHRFVGMMRSYVGESMWEAHKDRILRRFTDTNSHHLVEKISYPKNHPLDFQTYKEILINNADFIESSVHATDVPTDWFSIENNSEYAKSIICTFFNKAGIYFDSSRTVLSWEKLKEELKSDPEKYKRHHGVDPLLDDDVKALKQIITTERNMNWEEVMEKMKTRTGRSHGIKRYKAALDALEVDYSVRTLTPNVIRTIQQLLERDDLFTTEIGELLNIGPRTVAKYAGEIDLAARAGRVTKNRHLRKVQGLTDTEGVVEESEAKVIKTREDLFAQGFIFDYKTTAELVKAYGSDEKRARKYVRHYLRDALFDLEEDAEDRLLNLIAQHRNSSVSIYDLALTISRVQGMIVNPKQLELIAEAHNISLDSAHEEISIKEFMPVNNLMIYTYADVDTIKARIDAGHSWVQIFEALEGEKRGWKLSSFQSGVLKLAVFEKDLEEVKAHSERFDNILYEIFIAYQSGEFEATEAIEIINQLADERNIPVQHRRVMGRSNFHKLRNEFLEGDANSIYGHVMANNYSKVVGLSETIRLGYQMYLATLEDESSPNTYARITQEFLKAAERTNQRLGKDFWKVSSREESGVRKEAAQEGLKRPMDQWVNGLISNFGSVLDQIRQIGDSELSEFEKLQELMNIQFINRNGVETNYFDGNYQLALSLYSAHCSTPDKKVGVKKAVQDLIEFTNDRGIQLTKEMAVRFVHDHYFLSNYVADYLVDEFFRIEEI